MSKIKQIVPIGDGIGWMVGKSAGQGTGDTVYEITDNEHRGYHVWYISIYNKAYPAIFIPYHSVYFIEFFDERNKK